MINRRRIKLPGGRALPYRADPMAKYLTDNVNEPAISSPSPIQPESPHADQGSSATSYRPDPRVLDMRAIDGSEITIVGAGALGSHTAILMAAMAALIIRIVDHDSVDIKHTRNGRTIYEPSQVNKKKVFAAQEKIERFYPLTRVVPYPFDIMDMTDGELCRLARRSALVIFTIDNGPALLRLNSLFYSIVETVFASLHVAGATGHAILTIPYISACLRCAMGITSANGIHTLNGEPAAGADFITVANQVSIIAAEVTYSKITGKPIERWDITKNLFFFANRRERHSPDGPGVVLQKVDKRPGCPVCSVPGNPF